MKLFVGLLASARVLQGGDLQASASDVYQAGSIADPHCLAAYATDGKLASENSWYEDFCAAHQTQSWFQADMGKVNYILDYGHFK